MIEITVLQKENINIGLISKGHAGYAESGYDIICSAVSVLCINLINSVNELTDDRYTYEMREEGYIHFELGDINAVFSRLLLDSCILGLQAISDHYGKKFIDIKFKEVQ